MQPPILPPTSMLGGGGGGDMTLPRLSRFSALQDPALGGSSRRGKFSPGRNIQHRALGQDWPLQEANWGDGLRGQIGRGRLLSPAVLTPLPPAPWILRRQGEQSRKGCVKESCAALLSSTLPVLPCSLPVLFQGAAEGGQSVRGGAAVLPGNGVPRIYGAWVPTDLGMQP